MPCAPRSHPASGDHDRDGWPGPRPTRPRPPPQFSSNFTIAIFWVRVSQKNVCQTHSLSIHLWETKPRWEKAKKKKKKKKRRLISREGFVHNLRTMLCTPLLESLRFFFLWLEQEKMNASIRFSGLVFCGNGPFCIMTSSSIPEHRFRPFLDQTPCGNSGGLVGRTA